MIRLRFRDGVHRVRCYRGLFFDRNGLSARAFAPKNPKVQRLLRGLQSSKKLEAVQDEATAPEAGQAAEIRENESDDNPTDAVAAEVAETPPEPPPVEPVDATLLDIIPPPVEPVKAQPVDRFAAARAAKAAKKASRDGSG